MLLSWPALQYLVTGAEVLVLVILSLPLWLRLDRRDRRLFGLALALAAVTFWIWPTERHNFSGHEEHYAQLLLSIDASEDIEGLFNSAPLLRGISLLLSGLPGASENWLLMVSAAFGALWSGSLAVLVRRSSGSTWLALLTLGLMNLDPHRLMWSHSGFNVIHPTALIGFAALLGWEAGAAATGSPPAGRARWTPWALAVAAGASFALAVSSRLDALSYAPVLAAVVWLGAPRGQRILWTVVCAAASAPWIGLGYVSQGSVFQHQWWGGEVGYTWRILSAQFGLVGTLDPWLLELSLLGITGVGLMALLRPTPLARAFGRPDRSVAAIALVAAALLLTYTAEHSFIDVGARHMLPARGFIVLLLCWIFDRAWRRTGPLAFLPLALVVLALWRSAVDMEHHYYNGWPDRVSWDNRSDAGLIDIQDFARRGCMMVKSGEGADGDHPGDALVDHLLLVDPKEARRLWLMGRRCVLWLKDRDDFQWSSISVPDRSRKLTELWRWIRIGHAEMPDGEPVDVWRMY